MPKPTKIVTVRMTPNQKERFREALDDYNRGKGAQDRVSMNCVCVQLIEQFCGMQEEYVRSIVEEHN